MWVEQAIFTSLARHGRSGYHLVARSRGVTEPEARTLAQWGPTGGALLSDAENPVALSYFPLGGRRRALARTCHGPPEYSGRGARQLYTHALILEEDQVKAVDGLCLALYRDALAQGILCHQADPQEWLEPVRLGDCYRRPDPEESIARIDPPRRTQIEAARARLAPGGPPLTLCQAGDRLGWLEGLMAILPTERRLALSFTVNLQQSAVRPVALCLVPPST